ncbi:MAG TPA: hypothetical protein DEQ09_03620 [Bacteroidales bacterium]|nr:hypothetical protein [Bacteroidales bacterium]
MINDITDDNVDRIRKDIINRGLTYEPLVDDILEHLCCMVEEKMECGDPFEKSYNDALGSINESGAFLKEVRNIDREDAGRDVIYYSGWGRDFIASARDYKQKLMDIIEDPVVENQVQDHLEFTGNVWFMEFGPSQVLSDPVIKIWYKHTDVLKGIKLAEYVAINYLLKE